MDSVFFRFLALFIVMFLHAKWFNGRLGEKIKTELVRLTYTDVSVKWVFPTTVRAYVFRVRFRDNSTEMKRYQVIVYPDFLGKPKSIFWEGTNPPLIEVSALSQSQIPFMDWLDRKFPPN